MSPKHPREKKDLNYINSREIVGIIKVKEFLSYVVYFDGLCQSNIILLRAHIWSSIG